MCSALQSASIPREDRRARRRRRDLVISPLQRPADVAIQQVLVTPATARKNERRHATGAVALVMGTRWTSGPFNWAPVRGFVVAPVSPTGAQQLLR